MDALPVGQRRLLDRRARGDARVRDHDVDAAELLDRATEGRGHVELAGDVAGDHEPSSAELGDRRRGPFAIQVERNHGRAERGERGDHGAADPARGSRHERDPPLQLARRRRQRELVQLERPVLDLEALGRGQRDEAVERVRAGHHLHRAVVEVAREARAGERRRDADEPEVLHQHDARVRIHHRRAGTVLGDVRAVVVAERRRELANARAQGGDVVDRGVERHPERHALCVHEVVGAGGADLDEGGSRGRRDELERLCRLVDAEQLRALGRDGTTDRGEQLQQRLVARGVVEARAGRPVEAHGALGALVDERDRLVDRIDRRAVGLLGGIPPDHEPVLREHHELQSGVVAHGLANLLRERESGADVGDPDRRVAEALARQPLAVGRSRQHVDAVGMRVVDVRRGHEGVQQRLDRRPRHRRVELAAHEVRDHLLVAHRGPGHQRQHLVEPQRGEAGAAHRREVAARALDPHHRPLDARMVDRGALRGGVSAAEVRDRAVGSEQVRGAHQLVEHIARRAAVGGPEVGGRGDQLGGGAHRAPRVASSAERSAAIRSKRPDARSSCTGCSAAPSAVRALAQSGRTSEL